MSMIEAAPPAQAGYAPEALRQLREAIRQLPPEEKTIFLLRQNDQLSYEQIARRHHRPAAVVKELMRSALRKLRPVAQEVASAYRPVSLKRPGSDP
jgi:RNA polymerase sigma factor (sigma-70 family)